MTIVEWLMLAQTLVLLVTGIIVWRYTRETTQMREAAQRQAAVMLRELEILEERHAAGLKEKESKLLPHFTGAGGRYDAGGKGHFKWINSGAEIRDLTLEPLSDFTVEPTSFRRVGSGSHMQVDLRWSELPHPESLPMRLNFVDMAGRAREMRLVYEFDGGVLHQALVE